MPKQIVLCPINANDYDQDVIEMAAIMAEHLGAVLHLVHVTLFPNTAHKGASNYFGESSVFNREHKRLLEIYPKFNDVETYHHHLTGYPAEMILRLVEKTEPLLLVLGTHGRKVLQESLEASHPKSFAKLNAL